ncbi:MAG: hypothetical protein LUH55_03340 [Bacteroides thetaiotaomicron]|nr:hypothetical protein [Bacteroides thetaiotaomicron]
MYEELLRKEFQKHRIFDFYWNESVVKSFEEPIKLTMVPQEYVSIYQKTLEFPLENTNQSSTLDGTEGKVTILLTSLEESFDVKCAVDGIDLPGAKCAILIKVNVFDGEHNHLFFTQFNLGSSEEEKIETTSGNIRRFSELY